MHSVNRKVKNLAGTAAELNSACEKKKKAVDTQNAETDGRVLLLMLLFTLRTQAHSCMHFELCSLSFKGGGMVERLRYWIRHQEVGIPYGEINVCLRPLPPSGTASSPLYKSPSPKTQIHIRTRAQTDRSARIPTHTHGHTHIYTHTHTHTHAHAHTP